MKVLKQGDIYAPEHLGRKDILIEGSRIARIADHIDEYDQIEEVEKVDLGGRILTPGYMDIHVHITGGGGESGPATRVPEASLSVLVRNGITTVVGLLGTDGITRSLENLLAKARAFNEEGITCRILTGAYGYPSPTITGSVERDIALIDLMVGVKIAMSDHRSSNLTGEQLISLLRLCDHPYGKRKGQAGSSVLCNRQQRCARSEIPSNPYGAHPGAV